MTRHKDSAQVCRLEVVDTGRRRRWRFEEKLRIVEERHQGHGQVSATARRHGISSSLLFAWRRYFREGRLGGVDVPSLLPSVILAGDKPATRPGSGGRMEVMIGEDRRVIVGADVDATALALARVLKVLGRR